MLDGSLAWWSYPLVVLDFETTGVDPVECMPVSVAAIRLEHGVERGAFYSLLRPGIPIPPGATEIHGITDEQCADAPELVDVMPQLFELAQGAAPVAYNGSTYDKLIFHRFIVGSDCPLFEPAQEWIDPLVMVRAIDRYVRGTGRHKLSATCERWGVPMPEGAAHNALEDVRAVGRLLAELVRIGKVREHVTLRRLLEYTAIKRAEQNVQFEKYLARVAAKEAQTAIDFDKLEGVPDGCRSD